LASVAAPGADKPEEETTVETYRLTPKLARRVTIIGVLLLIGFAALVLRLWTLQVLAGSQYAARAQANQLRTVPVAAPRGTIVDRNGDVLVTNEAVTSVELWPSGLPKQVARRAAELKTLAQVTRVRLHAIRKGIVAREQAND
jgi:cell division protein FtsI/penicillin-binding protein 2